MDNSTGIKAAASPSKNLSSWLRFKSNKSNDSIPKMSRNKNDENAQNNESGIGSGSINYLRPPPPPHSSSPQQQQQQTSPQKSRPSFTKSFSSGAQKVIPMVRSPLLFKGDGVSTQANTNSNGPKKIFAYKQFRDDFLKDKHQFQGQVFGVSLEESLKTSSAEVILQSDQVFFGRIPTVVAKCGSFLKKNALDHQGIFRIAGNNNRVKNLQFIFSEPPSYGLSFDDWNTNEYTVHDAATILRRYLNNLEEPLIPLKFYDKFREPLEKRPRILKNMKKGNSNFFTKQQEIELKLEKIQFSSLGSTEKNQPNIIEKRKANVNKRKLIKDIRSCLKEYEESFLELLNNDYRQLLIYLLDLLSLFAQHSEKNLMSSKNLAAIFQPSILSHPDHDMNPSQYELSRYCVEFLIDFSYKLLPHILNIPKDKLKQSSTGAGVTTSLNVSEEQEKENESESESGNDLEKFPTDENEGPNVVVQSIGSSGNTKTHKRTASRPYSKSLSAKPSAVHDVLRIVNKDPKHGSEQEEDDDDEDDEDDAEFADDSDILNVTNGSVDEHNNTTIDYQDYMDGLGFEPINFVSSPMGSTGVHSGANLVISPVTSNDSSSILVGSQPKSETLLSRPLPPAIAVHTKSEMSQIAVPIPKVIKTSELLDDMPETPEKTSKLKKRESWFQKLRNQSSF